MAQKMWWFDSTASKTSLVALLLLNLLAAACGAAVLASEPCAEAIEQIKAGQLKVLEDSKTLESCAQHTELEEALNVVKRRLGDASQKLAQVKARSASSGAYIEPALQWAQSPENVFINVKFAHKLDAPACIDLVDPVVDIEEGRVMISANCKDKYFKLDLVLFSSIVKDNSSWAMTSVGRGSFTLAKQTIAKWDRLLSSREKPKNLHVWWAMQEKFDQALSNLKDAKPRETASPKGDEGEAQSQNKADEQPDNLTVAYEAARKKIQEQTKRAKKEITDKATAKKAKLQKEIESITSEENSHITDIDTEMTAALAKLKDKLNALKLRQSNGESVEWGEEQSTEPSEEKSDSFLGKITRVIKKAFSAKEEV